MATICITLPYNTRIKLKEVKNVSGLIAKLLDKHFMVQDSLEVLNLKKEELITEMDSKIEEINRKIENKEIQMVEESKIKPEDNRTDFEKDWERKQINSMWKKEGFSEVIENTADEHTQ